MEDSQETLNLGYQHEDEGGQSLDGKTGDEPDKASGVPEPEKARDVPEPGKARDVPEPGKASDVPEPGKGRDVPIFPDPVLDGSDQGGSGAGGDGDSKNNTDKKRKKPSDMSPASQEKEKQRRAQLHRDNSKAWHMKWVSKGVPREPRPPSAPGGEPEGPAEAAGRAEAGSRVLRPCPMSQPSTLT